jgi:hypothetical protein
MSNTLTNVSQAMLEDKVLPALRLDRNPINAFSYQVANTPKAVGDTIKVSIASAMDAAAFTSTYASGDATVTSTNVAVTAPVFRSWHVQPELEGMPTQARWIAQGVEAAQAVVKKILQDALGLFVLANIGNVDETDVIDIAAANYDSDDQADLWRMLAGKKVTGPRSAIHSIAYAANLMKDGDIKDASAYGSGGLIQTGELPAIFGTRQFYTDLFPTAITDENTEVIYTGTETVAIGFAEPMEVEAGLQGASGVQIMRLIDPATGIPLIWRTWYEANTGKYWGSVFTMRGQAFLRNSAVRVVSALTT